MLERYSDQLGISAEVEKVKMAMSTCRFELSHRTDYGIDDGEPYFELRQHSWGPGVSSNDIVDSFSLSGVHSPTETMIFDRLS